jgi:hypothetical protein
MFRHVKNPAARIAALFIFSFIFLGASSIAQTPLLYKKNRIAIQYAEADKDEVRNIAEFIRNGTAAVKKFFGRGFPKEFVIQVLPDRKSLTETWRKDWNVPDLQTECWMVASGTAGKLSILSPHAWKTEACEHDPADTRDTQLVMTHELVHVFHGQMSPNPNFEGMDDIGWFAEGVAVFASGQLDAPKLAPAREAIEKGKAPARLEDAWSGKYRYGVSGSLVKYIDTKYGRDMTIKLLASTTEADILSKLSTTEPELLAAWKNFVLTGKY